MTSNLTRRQFVEGGAIALVGAALTGMVGCSGGETATSAETAAEAASASTPEELVFAWEPGASEGQYENMRDLIAEAISEAAGIPCKPMTTTDYNVCIEAVNSGQAHYASLGAKEYVELHKRNPAVQVAWVLSDDKGELNQVSYHSQILVLEENAAQYLRDGEYKLEKEDVQDHNVSWVDLSSTSGYVIPTTVLAAQFGLESPDELGESDAFCSTVLFGGSHVNSIFNVLTGDADLCACDDTGAANNYTVVEGENGVVGSLYEIKEGLDAPLDQYAGTQLRVIASFEVPAVPFVVNTDYVPAELNEKIVAYMCSDAVSDNPQLFKDPDDKETVTKWTKDTEEVSFVPADDSYYDPFRKTIGEE